MPTNLNLRGNLETDPIRNFKFIVDFNPIDEKNWTESGQGSNGNGQGTTDNQFKTTVGFTNVSGLAQSIEAIPYREGSYNTNVHFIPGQTSFSPVTFQKGVMLGQKQNWLWMKRLYSVDGATGIGGPGRNFRCNITVSVLSHPNPGSRATQGGGGTGGNGFSSGQSELQAVSDDHIALKFGLVNAWITSIAYSDLNAGDNAVMVEQCTVVHEGFDLAWANSYDDTSLSGSNVFSF